MDSFDVLILGAGAAGMMCALEAGKRGRKVGILEHGPKPGRKILISGGGRCNFTNLSVDPSSFVSGTPRFAASALARYTPEHFIDLVRSHGIAFHEKTDGQLFCDGPARQIVDLLTDECGKVGVRFITETEPRDVEKPGRFVVRTGSGGFEADSLVVATGGLSVPEAGASDFGYRVARGFGLAVTETAPALVGFRLSEELLRKLSPLSGVSLAATVKVGKTRVNDQLLFTHWGLSGPAVLKASLLWRPGLPVEIDLLPDTKLGDWLGERKKSGEKSIVKNLLTRIFPDRIAKTFTDLYLRDDRPLVEIPDKTLEAFGDRVNRWKPEPSGTMGYERAEVTRGGVDTRELSSQTMESRKVPGLYFVGEVVDVTGQLGGYNFQWAWASGWAAGQVV